MMQLIVTGLWFNCNLIVIPLLSDCNKIDFSFCVYESSYYAFSDFHISELYEMPDNVINKCSTRRLIIRKALLQTEAYW